MVDFTKLRDPAYRAELAERRAKEDAEQSAFEDKCRNAINLCETNYEALSSNEGEFVLSLRNGMVLYFKVPSEKQQKWLFDIAARFDKSVLNEVTFESPRLSKPAAPRMKG